jgi:hypothetical protein
MTSEGVQRRKNVGTNLGKDFKKKGGKYSQSFLLSEFKKCFDMFLQICHSKI